MLSIWWHHKYVHTYIHTYIHIYIDIYINLRAISSHERPAISYPWLWHFLWVSPAVWWLIAIIDRLVDLIGSIFDIDCPWLPLTAALDWLIDIDCSACVTIMLFFCRVHYYYCCCCDTGLPLLLCCSLYCCYYCTTTVCMLLNTALTAVFLCVS